ncbi:MAG: protein kinase domain-containing protein [Solirubrobacteraceae bacterium]
MPELQAGDEIAGYRIETVVGRGGMGVVYRATQLALARSVALKVIAPEFASEVQFRERFKREARTAASINHPNVIAIHDAREEGDVLCITMDYIDGMDLRTLLRQERRLTPRRVAAIVGQVADALDAAHRRGLVHRDVKPANVLISVEAGREHVYLTDFGLTKSSSESGGVTATGMVVGTVDYMAPEQVRGDRVDGRTDVYALGCILYQAVTGRVPYERDSDIAKMFAHASEPPPSVSASLSDAPLALDDVVARAMAKDPAARFSSAGELGRAALAAVGLHEMPSSAERGVTLTIDSSERAVFTSAPTRSGRPFPRALDPARSRLPFAGRGAELNRLLGALNVTDGERQMIAIAGDPGMGKTRLAGELARVAHERGAIVLYGRCYETPLAPYQPFVETLRLLIASEGVDWIPVDVRRELGRVLPELRESLPDEPEAEGNAAEAARLRLFEEIATTFAHIARRGPLVVVLDDLHWGDRPTMLLLSHLLRSPDPAALTVVAAYRESELARGHPLRELMPELDRDGRLARIRLDGLDEEATGMLLAAVLDAPPGPDLIRSIAAESGGNPFFIEQVVRHLLAADALEQHPEGFTFRAGHSAVSVPPTVRELIRGRVERLGKATTEALEAAAVCGQVFSPRIVADASRLGLADTLDALEAADAAQLIRPAAQRADQWTFAHGLIRSALYETLTQLRRARLHVMIADALESVPDVEPAELAGHAFGAISVEGPARAIRAARQAAERALRGLAYEEAAEYYGRALDALEHGGRPDRRGRCELLLGLGEAQARAADAAAADTFAAATAEARALVDPQLVARAALGRCGIGVAIVGLDRARVEGLEEALALLGDRAPALRARLLARLAIEVYYARGRERSDALSVEAVAVARATEDVDALLAGLNARHVALWSPDNLDERLTVSQEMIDLARQNGRLEQEVQGRNWRCVDLWESGAIEAFGTEAAAHARLANELRLPAYRWYEPLWQGSLAALRGDYTRAAQLVAEAEAAGERAADRNAGLFAYGMRTWMHTSVGTFTGSGLAEVDEYVRGSPSVPAWRCLRAWFLAELGRIDDAQTELDALANDGFSLFPKDANWMPAVAELTEAVRILGDRVRAAELYTLLLPYRDRHLCAMRAVWSFGPVEDALGTLAATAGEIEAAREHYEAALSVEESWRALVWLVRTSFRYAELLAARGGRGDKERARRLANRALADVRSLGLPDTAVPSVPNALAALDR